MTRSKLCYLIRPVSVCQTSVSFSHSVRNFGVYFDSDLSMKEHVNFICKIAFLELRRISTVRHYLILDATEILVVSFVFSRIDYCNSLLVGLPDFFLIQKLQRVQNCVARLVLRCPPRCHVKRRLKLLHWFPVKARIDCKTACLCYNAVNSCTPLYLSDNLHLYSPCRSLRSASDRHSFSNFQCTNAKAEMIALFRMLVPLSGILCLFLSEIQRLSNLSNRLSSTFMSDY